MSTYPTLIREPVFAAPTILVFNTAGPATIMYGTRLCSLIRTEPQRIAARITRRSVDLQTGAWGADAPPPKASTPGTITGMAICYGNVQFRTNLYVRLRPNSVLRQLGDIYRSIKNLGTPL